MNKGISFYFGYDYENVEQRVKDIKEAGFDCVRQMQTRRLIFKTPALKTKLGCSKNMD